VALRDDRDVTRYAHHIARRWRDRRRESFIARMGFRVVTGIRTMPPGTIGTTKPMPDTVPAVADPPAAARPVRQPPECRML
jgi:hypothetical protein